MTLLSTRSAFSRLRTSSPLRHRQIGDDHVRSKPPGRVDELVAVAYRTDHIEIVLFEQADETLLHDRVVVGYENSVRPH
jgi:hypothetical protein